MATERLTHTDENIGLSSSNEWPLMSFLLQTSQSLFKIFLTAQTMSHISNRQSALIKSLKHFQLQTL